ncbi:MAG TPA: hypothetical protein VF765_11000, partial [Polyangiaceae bacterium]
MNARTSRRRLAASFAMGAMALGCTSPAASSGSSAAPEQAADATPAATAAVDAPPPAWLRYETPADAAPADVEALPLSPYRAEKLAEDVEKRTDFVSGVTQHRRAVVVADTFVLGMADPSAPIDAAADAVRRETAFLWRGKLARRLYEGVI